jgi:hypothetical protein
VPSIYQFTRNTEEREMLKLGVVKPNSYGRSYAMPPGVPRDRVRAVEAALLKTRLGSSPGVRLRLDYLC